MSDEQMTIAAGGWSESHRSMRVEKVENGYVVHVRATRERVDYDGKKRPCAAEEQWVATDIEQVSDMLRSYFK